MYADVAIDHDEIDDFHDHYDETNPPFWLPRSSREVSSLSAMKEQGVASIL